MNVYTANFEHWGHNELSDGADLLKLYADNGANFLGDGVMLNFNDISGNVFLSDEDFNVAVEEDGKLVQFYTCPNCGYEGTQQDALDDWTHSQSGEDGDIKDFEKFEGFCSKECKKENE